MFENVDQQNPVPATAVEDIFANTEQRAASAVGASPLRPASSVPGSAIPMRGSGSRRGLIVGLVIVVLGIGGAAYWWFTRPSVAPAPAPATTEPTAPAAPEPPPQQPAAPAPVADLDTDGDGLSDAKEAELGINPANPDTDGDGLFDGEEVNVYHTDAKNPDTDGDGFTDGVEVHNGYNPLGTGKLLELPKP